MMRTVAPSALAMRPDAQRSRDRSAIAAHHGRIVKRTGDGSIIEFRPEGAPWGKRASSLQSWSPTLSGTAVTQNSTKASP